MITLEGSPAKYQENPRPRTLERKSLLILVTSIVIQINRNELVSRIQKTPPHQITFDRQLLSSVLQYVLPLLLALGALSVPLSDVVRSLLEPLFR